MPEPIAEFDMTTVRKLQIHEAWYMLMLLWLNPRVAPGNVFPDRPMVGVRVPFYARYEDGFPHDRGLCDCLSSLESIGWIDTTTCRLMYKTISHALDESENSWLFPRTLEGAKQRAEFCREQYELALAHANGEHAKPRHEDCILCRSGL